MRSRYITTRLDANTYGVWDRTRQRVVLSGSYGLACVRAVQLEELHNTAQARRNDETSALRRSFS